MAFTRKGAWTYTWGRGRAQKVTAPADEAADRIWGLAQ
ncbi:hypothetical protein BJ982_006304 [Sphaerisporangium siamense]|uniref:Uncharacterized protein n=1 Tax=Sphaerisporangium siamense TaxID=795645 RepID=A0A7W7DDC9_9ACTN|nr:hypothetical protein [Sphaerisporangium siamense]